ITYPRPSVGPSNRPLVSVNVVATSPPLNAFTSTRTLAAGSACPSITTEPAMVDPIPPFETKCDCACAPLHASASNKHPGPQCLNIQRFLYSSVLYHCIAYFSSNHGAMAGPPRGPVL